MGRRILRTTGPSFCVLIGGGAQFGIAHRRIDGFFSTFRAFLFFCRKCKARLSLFLGFGGRWLGSAPLCNRLWRCFCRIKLEGVLAARTPKYRHRILGNVVGYFVGGLATRTANNHILVLWFCLIGSVLARSVRKSNRL